jgi:anti-sigma B factor antagonist
VQLADDATNAPFDVRIERDADRTSVISVCGEIDMATAPRVEAAFALCGQSCDVMLDLTEVTFLDSSALKVLALNAKKMRSAGYEIRVKGLSDHQRRLMNLMGLDRVLNLA